MSQNTIFQFLSGITMTGGERQLGFQALGVHPLLNLCISHMVPHSPPCLISNSLFSCPQRPLLPSYNRTEKQSLSLNGSGERARHLLLLKLCSSITHLSLAHIPQLPRHLAVLILETWGNSGKWKSAFWFYTLQTWD